MLEPMPDRDQPRPTLLRTVIERAGLSRRKAFALIREGRVTVEGSTVADPSAPYEGGVIGLDGAVLAPAISRKTYLIMNKPAGILTTTFDPHGRRTVLDLVPTRLRVPNLHPVGRLDLDTTGLLLLTNDGDLTFRLTHPSHEVEKEYWLASRPPLNEAAIARLAGGVPIDGALRVPVEVRRLRVPDYDTAIVISEGRKRQVRRMVETLGARIVRLKRVREGGLSLSGLREGEVRELRPGELEHLEQKERDPARPGGRASGRRRPR